MDYRSKCEIKIIVQLLEDNTGGNLGDLGVGDDFLHTPPNV